MTEPKDYFSRISRLARRAIRAESAAKVADVVGHASREAKKSLTTQNVGLYAVSMVREILDNYILPSPAKLSYSGIRNLRQASTSGKLDSGVVTVFAEVRSPTGVNLGFDFPVEIREGTLVEPSVAVFNGSPRIIAQSTFDGIVASNTIFEELPVRRLYEPPMDNKYVKESYSNRVKTERVNRGMFNASAAKDVLRKAVKGLTVNAVDLEAQSVKYPVTIPRPKLKVPGHPGFGYGDTTNKNLGVETKNERIDRDRTHTGPNLGDDDLPDTHMRPVTAGDVEVEAILLCMPDDTHSMIFGVPGKFMATSAKTAKEAMDQSKARPISDEDAAAMYAAGKEVEFPKSDKAAQYRAEGDEHLDPHRNETEDDFTDPAESKSSHDIVPGSEISLKEDVEVKDRGGVSFDYPKGSKVCIVRDLAGDNKEFVVKFEDGREAIVERCFLAKTAHEDNGSSLGKQSSDIVAKVNQELKAMLDDGISEIDAREAVLIKYGKDIADQIFGK